MTDTSSPQGNTAFSYRASACIVTCWCLCRSAALVKACTLALGPASAHLHPTDAQTRQEVVDRLLTLMASHSSTSLRAVCAESLGLFVASSTESKTLSGADAQAAAVRIAEGLLRMLCTLCSAAVAPVGKLVQSVPDLLHKDCLAGVQSGLAMEEEHAEVVQGIMAGKDRLQLTCLMALHAACVVPADVHKLLPSTQIS